MKTENDNNLYTMLRSIKDPRRSQGRMHKIEVILLTSIMAVMNGAASICAIHDFAETNKKELIKLFKLQKQKRKIPSRETISRLFSLISFEQLSLLFYEWASSKIKIKKGDVLSLDGKAIRGTLENPNDSFQNFTSLVSVYVQKSKQILSLEKIESKKESEIPIVRKLIKMLDLEGVTFTMDSLHCQKETVKEIVKSKNNYIIQVKGNQPTLHDSVKKKLKQANQGIQ